MFLRLLSKRYHATGLSAPSFGENAKEDRFHMFYGRIAIPECQDGHYEEWLSKCRNAIEKWVDMVSMKVENGLKVIKLK